MLSGHLVGDLRNRLAAIAEPDRPVVMLPGRQAAEDLLGIKTVLCPELLPDPLPAWPAAVCGCVSVGGNPQETQHVVRQRVKKTGHAHIEPLHLAAERLDAQTTLGWKGQGNSFWTTLFVTSCNFSPGRVRSAPAGCLLEGSQAGRAAASASASAAFRSTAWMSASWSAACPVSIRKAVLMLVERCGLDRDLERRCDSGSS
jgi:hypothetical protein